MPDNPFGNWTEAVWNAIRSAVRVGVVGRQNADGTTTITVDGRDHYIYVRTGPTQTGGEILEAYNKGVPRLAGAPVLLIKWNRVWTVIGVDADSPAVTSTLYSVAYHVHKRDNGLAQSVHDLDGMPSSLTGRGGALLRVNDDEDGYYLADSASGGTGTVDSVNGLTGDVILDADDIAETASRVWFTPAEETKLAGIEALADVTDATNVGSSIHGATAKTTPVDADTMPLIDSAASNVLKKVTWANVKATLKTYFDTLYTAINTAVLLTGNQTVAGVKTFTSDIIARSFFYVGRAADGLATAYFYAITRNSGDASNFGNALGNGAIEFAGTGAAGILFGMLDGKPVALATNSLVRLYIGSDGKVGIGTTVPQARFHIHDGTSGFLKGTITGVNNAAVTTIIPDGTGDVTKYVLIRVIAVGSGGSIEVSGSMAITTPASSFTDSVVTSLVVFRLYSTGQLAIYSATGAQTWSVTVDLMWQ